MEAEHALGDHRVVALRVLGSGGRPDARPTVYWRRQVHGVEDATSGTAV